MCDMLCTSYGLCLHRWSVPPGWILRRLGSYFLVSFELSLFQFRTEFLANLNYLSCIWNPFQSILAPAGSLTQFPRSPRPPQGVNQSAHGLVPAQRCPLSALVLEKEANQGSIFGAFVPGLFLVWLSQASYVINRYFYGLGFSGKFSLFYKNHTFFQFSPLFFGCSDIPLPPKLLSFIPWLLLALIRLSKLS